jgi:hypothetical protein
MSKVSLVSTVFCLVLTLAAAPSVAEDRRAVDRQRAEAPKAQAKDAIENAPPQNADMLKALAARAGFEKLSECESKLLENVTGPYLRFCGPSPKYDDPANNPDFAGLSEKDKQSGRTLPWGPQRTVRADLIRWLIVDPEAAKLIDPKGIDLYAALVDGPLNLYSLNIPFPLVLRRCHLGDLNLGYAKTRSVSLYGSRTGEITAEGVNVDGALALDNVHAEGGVFLRSANIEGNFTCNSARFDVDGGTALDLGTAELKRSWYCIGASVRTRKPPYWTLFAESSRVGGDVFLRNSVIDSVKLSGASIKGDLDVSSAKLGLLMAEVIHVDGDILLNRSTAGVDVVEGTVGGSLIFKEATIPAGGYIHLRGAKVARELNLTELAFLPLEGRDPWDLDLTEVAVGYLVDDSKSWPDSGRLWLDGFVYGRFQGDKTPRTASQRLDWIRRQLRPDMSSGRPRPSAAATPSGTPPPSAVANSGGIESKPTHVFATQPYLQLAKVLREAGDDPGATQVLIAMERDRHRYGEYSGWRVLWPFYRLWGWILDATVGYGYRPWQGLVSSLLLVVAGAFVFRAGYGHSAIAPYHPLSYEIVFRGGEVPKYDPPFSAFWYSLDTFLPIVDLRQKDRWMPDLHSKATVRDAIREPFKERKEGEGASEGQEAGNLGKWLRIYLWFHTLLGWLLMSLFAGAITGILH